MCQRAIIILLLASLALFSQAQRAQRGYTGSLSTAYSSSLIYIRVYCGGSSVIYTSFSGYETSPYTISISSYPECYTLYNDIDDDFTITISGSGADPQNVTYSESQIFATAYGSYGRDFYPNTPKTLAVFPGFVNGYGSYISYNFTVALIGTSCGDGIRSNNLGEECDGWTSTGCDDDTCTCRYSYYVDTTNTANVDCLTTPGDYYSPSVSTGFGLWLGIFIPIFVVIIVLSVVMRVLFIRGVIACCGVRRARTTVTTTTVVQPATTTTTTTTTAVQPQPYPQPQVTEVAYYPQPQAPQYPQQQQHVVPPQQQHVMQYPQQYPPQQPNVDGPVVPQAQYSQPMMQQQQYPPQPYPEQPTPYNYPGGNAPVQGGYVVYSPPPPQNGAFQPPK
jgi:hypothetical protein